MNEIIFPSLVRDDKEIAKEMLDSGEVIRQIPFGTQINI